MKYLIYVLIILLSLSAKSQQRFPSGFPTQFNTGWNKWGYAMSDSGLIVANRDTNWLAKYSGTVVFKPSNKQFYWFDSLTLRWNQFGSTIDTTSLSNRINLKLNISDTATMLLPYLRKADTTNKWVNDIRRLPGSVNVEIFKNGAWTTAYTDSVGVGASGLTSVGLSLPSAFTVTNSPLTSNGTLNVIGAGTALQYIRGNGTLATTDTGMIPNFHLKVRSLFSGTSPITFNSTTGAIGINNATATGTKGAAAFTGSFSDNGSGLIDLLDLVSAGSCTNCNITFDAKGRATAFSNGTGGGGSGVDTIYRTPGTDSIYFTINGGAQRAIKDSVGSAGSSVTLNNTGAGFRWLATPGGNFKTVSPSNTVLWDSTSTANTLTAKVDTSVIGTQFDLLQKLNISDTIYSHYIAYVDTLGNDATGVLNNPAKPFATLNGALDALPSFGGKIQIGIGEFLVPDTGKIKSNVWFSGSGMPHYDDTNTVVGVFNVSTPAITKMIGGTIIHGFFSIPYNRNNVDMSDLGVDNGSAWINANNGGVALDCIAYAQKYGPGLNSADGFHLLQTSANPRTGINVWNASVLVKDPSSLVHGFIFENMINPDVHNIYSCYGFAGIVIKTMGGIYSGLHAKAHSDAGIYVKSNDYSYCYGVVLNGFEIGSIGSYDGGGLHLNANDGGSPGLYECDIANGIITQTKYGVKSMGVLLDGIHLDNVKVALIQGDGYNFPNLYYSLINNCNARVCGGDGFNIGNGGTGKGPFISNCLSASNTGDGFEVGGSQRVELENVYSENNTGFGIQSTGANVYVGLHTEINNTAGATTGTLNTKLTVGVGGTGNTSFTAYALLAGGTTSTGALQQVSGLGTSGQVLTSNGAGTLPTWQTATSGITTLNTLTAATQTFAVGTANTDFNIVSSGSTHTFNIPSASTSNRGLVTIGTQTFGGAKTFNDGLISTSTSFGNPRVYINGNIATAQSPGINGVNLGVASITFTDNAGAGSEGTGQHLNAIFAPTITSPNARSYDSETSTLFLGGAPIAAGSMTLAHPYNIYANDVSYISGLSLGLNEQSGDVTLGNSSHNIYTGAGGNTWTLPSLVVHPGKIYHIKNAGGGNLTVQRGGSDNIYDTGSVTSITVSAGSAIILVAGSSFWYTE